MPKYDLQHFPLFGVPLSGVAPAAADNTADHGDFAQVWRWKLARPSNTGLRITELVASTATGTSPLVQIDTLAASTAIPLLVKTRGTEVFRVSATTTQILAADGSGSAPSYGFQSSPNSGVGYGSNGVSLSTGATAMYWSGVGNLMLYSTTVPTSMMVGIILGPNQAEPSGNPGTNESCIWSAAGILKYRTATASEGAGQNNIIHNRTANVVGAGTNYTLTTSWARIDFGTTDADLTLPTAGTYLLIAQIQYTPDVSGDADSARFMLLNATDSLDIGTPRYGKGVPTVPSTVVIIETVTVTAASKVIRIQAVNDTANRGVITSTGTTLHYIRLS